MADILSGIGAALRPLAKELIKGGISLFDAVSDLAAETGEQFKDLVAEAKAELAKPRDNGEPPEDKVDKEDGPAS